MVPYLMQIFLFRFVQLIMFKYMYNLKDAVFEVVIDRQRTLFQVIQFAAVFAVQISMFIMLLKKVYLKKYVTWMFSLRQSLNPFMGISVILIPLGIYVMYFNNFTGEYFEYNDETLVLYILFFFIGALAEELVFRGYFYKMLIKKNRKMATYLVLFQAVIFTLAHINNPGNSYVRIGILFLAGILLGLIALRGFLYAVMFHFLWNFLQAYLLGVNVSGYRFVGAVFNYPNAPAWESNIVCGLLLGVVVTVFLAIYYRDRKKLI